jgi:hypothetical protein
LHPPGDSMWSTSKSSCRSSPHMAQRHCWRSATRLAWNGVIRFLLVATRLCPRTRKLSTGLASDAPSAWGMRRNTPGALGCTTVVIVIAPAALAQHCHGAVESLPRRVVEAGSRGAQPGADGDSGDQQEEKTEHALFTPCIVMSHNNRVLYICSVCTHGKSVDLDVGRGKATTCCKWGGCGELVHGA